MCVKCCLPRNLIRDSVPMVFIGGTSAQHIPKLQTLRRKAGVKHKPHYLHKNFGTVNDPNQLGHGRNILKI